MKTQRKTNKPRPYVHDRARGTKALVMLVTFVFGHLFPVALIAAPIQTEITAHSASPGTQIEQNGNVYDVTTTQSYKAAGINHFDKYNVGAADLVNMHIPTNKTSLVNFIHGGRSNINGIVNAIKNGQIGGDIYFANSDGIVVGENGVINAGSIHLSTPSRAFLDSALNSSGSVDILQSNSFPISDSGLIQVEGKLNAIGKATLKGGEVVLSGAEINAGNAAKNDIQINYGDIVNVESMDTAQSIGVDENGVIELFGSSGVKIKKKSKVIAQGKKDGGKVTVKSTQDIVIEDSSIAVDASASGKAGDINVEAVENIHLENGTLLSAAGSGADSDGGNVIVFADNETSFEEGAKIVVDAGNSGDAGFGEVSAIKSVFLNGGSFSGRALNGEAGSFLIDPEDLVITEDVLHLDGSSITYRASNSFTARDVLLFSGIFSSGDLEAVRNDGVYTVDVGSGAITIEAPVISLINAQLVSGGNITLDATFDQDSLQGLANLLPFEIPDIRSSVSLDNALLRGGDVDVRAGISWSNVAFDNNSETSNNLDLADIEGFIADHTRSFISDLLGLRGNVSILDLESSISIENSSTVFASNELKLSSSSELDLNLGESEDSSSAFSLILGIVDNASQITIDNSTLTSESSDVQLSSTVSTAFSGTVKSVTSAGDGGAARAGAVAILVSDIDSKSEINIDTDTVISAAGNIGIESEVTVETQATVEAESGAGGPAGIGVLVNNERAESILNLGGEYSVGDGADLEISSLIDSNHTASNAVTVSTAEFEEEDDEEEEEDERSAIASFLQNGLNGVIAGLVGEDALATTQGQETENDQSAADESNEPSENVEVTETRFAFTGGVNVINLDRNSAIDFNGKISSQTGADLNQVNINSRLSSYDENGTEIGAGLQGHVTSDADAEGDGESRGSVSLAVAFQELDVDDDVRVTIGDGAEFLNNAANVDIASNVKYLDPDEKFFAQTREAIAAAENYFNEFSNSEDNLADFFLNDGRLREVLGLYQGFEEFRESNDIDSASSLQEFIIEFIHNEITSGFTSHVAATARGSERAGIASSISIVDIDSSSTIEIAANDFLGGSDSSLLTTSNVTQFNHSVMPLLTQVFALLGSGSGLIGDLTSAPNGGVGLSLLNESYDLVSKVEITADQLGSRNLEINSSQNSDLLKIIATGGSAARLGIVGSILNQNYTTDTASDISALVNGNVTVTTKDHFNDYSLAGAVVFGSNAIGASVLNQDIQRSAASTYNPATKGDVSSLSNITLNTSATGEQDSIAVAGAITTRLGSRLALAASFTHIETSNEVVSLIGNLTAADLVKADLTASDNTSYSQVAGALALNVTGTAGFGGASSSGVFNNKIESSLVNVNFGMAGGSGQSVTLKAHDYTTNSQFSIAAAGGRTVGIAGSVNTLIIGSSSLTTIDESTITGFNNLRLEALDQAENGAAKETSFITGGLAIGGRVGIGASVATYTANKEIRSTISNSTIDLNTSLDSNASRNENVTSTVVAGGIGGTVGIAGAVSVYNAGSEVKSEIVNADISATELTVSSQNRGEVEVLNIALGIGGTAGLAGSVVVNNLGDTTESLISGSGSLQVSGNTSVTANLNQTTDFDVASAAAGGNVGVAGTVVVNTINNTTRTNIGSGYTIGNSGGLSLTADSNYTRRGFAGAIAGGTVGLGAVVTVDNIQNTTESLLAAETVDISGEVDVQANARNDFNLLALNVSGGKVAIGATVNIVNLGGDISGSTSQLNGSNRNEYNAVVAEYNIGASTGATNARIESETINAASINLVAKQDNDLELKSGGLSIGGAAIGVGVGVVDVQSQVTSSIGNNGVYNLTGAAGLNITSLADTNAKISSYAGSVGIAAFNVRVSDYSSTANAITSIGNNTSIDLNDTGSATIEANVEESSNVSNISAQIGGVAASGALVRTTHQANTAVNIANGAEVLNATNANINSRVTFANLDATATGLSAGIVAAAALVARVNIESSKARINTGVGSQISGGSVNINSDLVTRGIDASVLAVNVGAAAIGLSDAAVSINSASGSEITLGGFIDSDSTLNVGANYNNQQNINVSASGASGGIVGVSAALAQIDNNGVSAVTLTNNADLNGDDITIASEANLRQNATAEVLAGGAIGVGVVRATINSHGQSAVNLAGEIVGTNATVSSRAIDNSTIENSSGAGGLVAGSSGGVFNNNQLDARVRGGDLLTLDTHIIDISTETRSSFDTSLDIENYGLIAGASGVINNNITQNSNVDLTGGVRYLRENGGIGSAANITAANTTTKADGISYQNTLAGLGGFSIGNSNTNHTSNAGIALGSFENADLIDLSLKATNDTTLNDTVHFDSYLLAGGSDSRSLINSTNDTLIEFQEGLIHVDSIAVDAYSNVNISSEVRAVVSGLIAVDVTSFNSAISQGGDEVIFRAGAEVLSDKEATINAGVDGTVDIDNRSYSYNRSILPVIPDADITSSGTRNGLIDVEFGGQLRAGGDITLAASQNENNVSGYALGHSLSLDIFNDFLQNTVGRILDLLGLPSSVKFEDEIRRAIVNDTASINIDGQVQSGLFNYYAVTFDALSGITEDSIVTAPIPDGVNAEYFQDIQYTLSDENFSASGRAAESLADLRLIIEAFRLRGLGREPDPVTGAFTPGQFQTTFDSLLQQEIFLDNIVSNGLSGIEFSQIQIEDLSITNGNISIDAPVVSGSGDIKVLTEAKVVVNNRSLHAVEVNDLVVDFRDGGEVIVNGLSQSGSFGGVSISNLSLADTHEGDNTAGISILGNTQESASILNPPPTLLNGRISYLGSDINITNERGSIISSSSLVLEGSNVRLAAGADIILGLDNQPVVGAHIVDQRQNDAISNLIGRGVSDVSVINNPNILSSTRIEQLRLAYLELRPDATGVTAATTSNVEALLTLFTDPNWQPANDQYTDFLSNELSDLNDEITNIRESEAAFLNLTTSGGAVITADDENVVEDDVWMAARTSALANLTGLVLDATITVNSDAEAELRAAITGIDTLAEFREWFDGVPITQDFTVTDDDEMSSVVTRTTGYNYRLNGAEGSSFQSLISDVEAPVLLDLAVNEDNRDQITAFNIDFNGFRTAVSTVFGSGGGSITQSAIDTSETISAATALDSRGATIAGDNIFISATAVNLNGYLQAGFDTQEITITENTLLDLRANAILDAATGLPRGSLTTAIAIDEDSNKLVQNNLAFRNSEGEVDANTYFVINGVDVIWNPEEERIEIADVEINGGNITIAGQLFNTGEGNINVVSGYGKVVIDNQTSEDIYVGDITNNYISGNVTLIDSSQSLDGAAEFKKTEFFRELNNDDQVQLVKNVYTRSGSEGEFIRVEEESSIDLLNTRQSVFNPRDNLVYTYQRFNLGEDDRNEFDDFTTIDIDGREISVAFDFVPVLSVDSALYDQIGESGVEGEFNVGTFSSFGRIQLAGNGDTQPFIENRTIVNRSGVEFFQVDVFREGRGFYNWRERLLAFAPIHTTTTFNGNNTVSDFEAIRNLVSGATSFDAIEFIEPTFSDTLSGTISPSPDGRGDRDYRFLTETRTMERNIQTLQFSEAVLDFSHDEAALRASNEVNINFLGFDRGEVSVKSGGSVSLGNILNSVGDTLITSANGSVAQRELGNIHSDDITITAGGGSIGSAVNNLNLFQDNDDHQQLSVSATEDLFVKSQNGALEFDSLSNGANSELVLIAEGDLLIKNHTEATQLAATNIHLESRSGELFESENIYTDIDSENGGSIVVKSNRGDIKIVETAGDLAVENIRASGDVAITVRDGGLVDAQDIEVADVDTIEELLSLWDELGIERDTDAARARVADQYEQIQEEREGQYETHWELRRQEEVVFAAALEEDFQYTLTSDELQFFDGEDEAVLEAYRETRQEEYEIGLSLRGEAYDPNFVGADDAETRAYNFYWNLDGNRSTQESFVAYNDNYVYELSDVEQAFYADDVQGGEDLINLRTQQYFEGAELIGDDRSAAVFIEDFAFEDAALLQDIEDKITWTQDELTSLALDFAYKEVTDTVLEIEDANIFAGGDLSINADFVGVQEEEIVILQTDDAGEITINELHQETIVMDSDGNEVIVNQATERAKLALLSAERNDIVLDVGGDDGSNASLTVVQREDFDIEARGELSINTTGNEDDSTEAIYLGSEEDITVRQLTSSGDVILKSTNDIIAAQNQSDSHILYGDVLVLESADGFIGGANTTDDEFLKVETNNTSILDTDRVGFSARANGSILIQNEKENQDFWIRDVYSRNGTIAIDASGSILDRDNLDFGGANDNINIGADRVELTSRNGSVGDDSAFGQIELNGDTVLVAKAASGVFVDGEDILYLEEIVSTTGDITITSSGNVELNTLRTAEGDISVNAQTITSYTVDPFEQIVRENTVITTTEANEVILTAVTGNQQGESVNLTLTEQSGSFQVTGLDKIVLNSSTENALNISSITSDQGAVNITQVGDLNVGAIGTATDLSIQTVDGNIDIDTIGGDFSLLHAEVHTPESINLVAAAEGAVVNIESLHIANDFDLQADTVNIGSIESTDHALISASVSGNDGRLSDSVTLNAVNDTPLLFSKLYAENFEITTDNDTLRIIDGNIGEIGTIATNLYNTQVSSRFQELGIYDFQLYAGTNDFDLTLIGADLLTTNYASYVDDDFLINRLYRTDESAISLMEKLNALSEKDIYYIQSLFDEELDAKNNEGNEDLELFESHENPDLVQR